MGSSLLEALYWYLRQHADPLIHAILRLYDTDETDVAFAHDYQVGHPRLDSLGVQAIVLDRFSI